VYTVCLNKYLEFPSSNKKHATDPRKVEQHVIEFVIFLKKQGKTFAAIHNYVSAICKYYKMNDVFLNTNKINQYLPEFRKSKKDRGYTHAEIQRLLDIVDERNRTIILLLASTGMRIGAIPGLRLILKRLSLNTVITEFTKLQFMRVLRKNILLLQHPNVP
jgi:integrase